MPTQPSIAKVVVNLALDREFDYRIPEPLLTRIRIGTRVFVPFGHGERVGYVVGLADHSPVPGLKTILRLERETEEIPESLVGLARWIADYYCCAREQAVRALLPGVVRRGTMRHKERQFATLAEGVDLGQVLPSLQKRARKGAALLQALVRLGRTCETRRLLQEAAAGPGVLTALVRKGLVRLEGQRVDRDPFAADVILPTTHLTLTPDQEQALAMVTASLEARDGRVILLDGVTGSGKTEVYLQAIDHCLKGGRDAIVLVPEIALTPQTVERFRGRFGETVSVMHSGLSDGERYDEWMRVREGRARIVVGARSALFAPCRALGLIVVDEEHENTYKQEEAPRYNARDVAVVRGQAEHATVLLGSATPSLESVHNALAGKYRLARLPRRVDHQVMPLMEAVDMRAEAMLRGMPQMISRRLESLVRDRLEKGEQTLLFLNRRGFATQMMCTKCGHVETCGDCNTPYTYHKQAGQLICHLCGRVLRAPQACPQCADAKIRYPGLGTEKVEALCQALFPHAVVARMDSDSMTTRDAYRRTLGAFRAGRTHILIGTQMIAKGLHFPNVTLVGILFADLGLHKPDFRAGERTFQLLVQVAGRAGRGEVPGQVVVQTYTPYHPVVQHALAHDAAGFVAEELETRRVTQFPPFTHVVLLHARGGDEAAVMAAAQRFLDRLQPLLEPATQVAGPMPAPIPKIRGQYRVQVLLRGGSIVRLTRLLRPLLIEARRAEKDVDVYADVDPYDLM